MRRCLLVTLLLALPFPASADECTVLRNAALALDQKVQAVRTALRLAYAASAQARTATAALDDDVILAEIRVGAAIDQVIDLDRATAALRQAVAAACPPVDVASSSPARVGR